jgi:hypothetical protein
VSKRAGRWGWQSVVCRVGPRSLEVLTNHRFKLLEGARLDIELPLKVGTHLPFHLVNLPERKHTLADDTPGLVGICVIADDLGGNHKCGDEEAVSGGTPSGNEPSLQSLQEIESGKGHGGGESRAMEGVGNEVCERRGRRVGGRRGWLVGTVEKVVDVAGAHLGGLLMPIVWVRMPGTGGRGGRLRGGGRGGDWSVDDLSRGPADVRGWGWMTGDDSGGHILERDKRLRK